jgi:hypothetical protein
LKVLGLCGLSKSLSTNLGASVLDSHNIVHAVNTLHQPSAKSLYMLETTTILMDIMLHTDDPP